MKPNTCPGTGQTPAQMVAAPAPGVRDLSTGRGTCPVCHRAFSLTVYGKVRGHVRNLALTRG